MAYHLNIRADIYCEEDLLGFDKYVDTLSSMISDKDFKTPFCIGIFGTWGSGKTSFMRLLEKKVLKAKTEPHAIPVWFNPWRYEKEEHLIIPFLKTIEYEIGHYMDDQKGMGQRLVSKLKAASQKLSDAAAAFAYGLTLDCKLAGFGPSLDVAKAAAREEELTNKRIESAKKVSEKLSSIYYEIVDQLKGVVDERAFRIVVFIDDLDRCLPEKAVELLEAIKLFLDIEGYLFVIGVDKNVVKKGISCRYRFFEQKAEKEAEGLVISPDDYLEKMIQLPLELPTIEHGRKRRFIETLLGDSDEFKEHADIIEAGVGENPTTLNPRTLKRFINLLAFTVRLAETVKENILNDRVEPKEKQGNKNLLEEYFIPLLYIKWTIIVFRFHRDHSDIKGNWRRLIELQEAARGEEKKGVGKGEEGEKKGVQIDERLKKVLVRTPLFPDNDWLIARFIHLTESTVISEKARDVSSGYRQSFQPGDMVKIPKGKFLYGDGRIEDEIKKDYYIDVFPVTNRQYREFIDRTDHEVPYDKGEWAKPYNWNKKTRTYPEGLEDHPVALVSYHDAVAFCKWRSEKEGQEFRLPTEKEWEKAARGEDGREYPWGNEFDKEKCNAKESGIRSMARVNRYPNGVSPYGCYDMAGNVWEWTGSWYDEGDKIRKVLRGGSWGTSRFNARCADRLRNLPDFWNINIGFRCVRALK